MSMWVSKLSVKSFVCNKRFTNIDSRDFHDSMHVTSNGFGYVVKDGKCVTARQYGEKN